MSYFSEGDMKDTTLWQLARRYTLLDNFFMGAFGGSFLNHIWLVCACAPSWPDPPNSQRSQVDDAGQVIADRRVTAKGDGDYAVNTTQSIFLNNGRQGENVLPPQHAVTIGDRLTEKGVPWAWYSGGWTLAAKSDRTPEEDRALQTQSFQWHHQPFAYFARFDPTTQKGRDERTAHLRDALTLEGDIKAGTLPPVAFYKPIGVLNQHPGYANLVPADEEVGRIVRLMEESPMKDSFAVVITYDENGGFYDHVAPPHGSKAGARADFFGPGTRVPTIVVSPLAPKGQVDHTEYETTSILKLVGERFRLNPLPSARYGAVESLAKAFKATTP
jgi:acid phosphatase